MLAAFVSLIFISRYFLLVHIDQWDSSTQLISHECQCQKVLTSGLSSIFAKCFVFDILGNSSMGTFFLFLCVYMHTILAVVEVPITVSVQIPVPDRSSCAFSILSSARLRFVSAIYTSYELTLIVIRNSDGVIFWNKWCHVWSFLFCSPGRATLY